MDKSDLIERLRAAEGPDRTVFRDVMVAVKLRHDEHQKLIDFIYDCINIGAWESAALALVAEVLPGATWLIGNEGRFAQAELFGSDANMINGRALEGAHKSPVIAILIALLQAKEASDE